MRQNRSDRQCYNGFSSASDSEPATTLLPGQDNSAPSAPMSEAVSFVVFCGVRLSEVGLSEFRKPQVVRSTLIA
jgi:hypothetical protein